MTSSGPNYYPQGVGVEGNMSLAVSRSLAPANASPAEPGIEGTDQRLNISVVFTSVESTLMALRAAGTLAASLGAQITLLGQSPVETSVHIYLCRDRFQTLSSVLHSRSIVVLGGRRRWWWHTRDEVLAKKLQRAGFEVVFKETE